jgi:hypothetical protein
MSDVLFWLCHAIFSPKFFHPNLKNMLVSHFELLVKRIAPLTGMSAVDAPFRRIVQGYFLTISNMDTRTVNLRLRTTIPIGSPAIDREFVPFINTTTTPLFNVQTGFDVASNNNVNLGFAQTTSIPHAKRFQTVNFAIKPNETVSVNLLPNIPGTLPNANFEVRGYAELIQQPVGLQQIFFGVPSAKLLVSAEYRGTVLDNDYPTGSTSNDLDFDQIAYAMPLAMGQASGVVEAVSGIAVIPNGDLVLSNPRISDKLKAILEGEQGQALGLQLAELNLDDELEEEAGN